MDNDTISWIYDFRPDLNHICHIAQESANGNQHKPCTEDVFVAGIIMQKFIPNYKNISVFEAAKELIDLYPDVSKYSESLNHQLKLREPSDEILAYILLKNYNGEHGYLRKAYEEVRSNFDKIWEIMAENKHSSLNALFTSNGYAYTLNEYVRETFDKDFLDEVLEGNKPRHKMTAYIENILYGMVDH